jgi:alkanesulfonate monooxygenase SsuD/methylene tetrahydromethanopterin reductase-like flavin-dependent oxidoreductase (luciferase family)
MAKLGIMIEGQEGLNWDRWRRICEDAENLGFASLRRSDHFISLMEAPERDCIECWVSLALAAEWTRTIEFGPMVSPMTFRLPSMLARMAASVDRLSDGRLVLGVGAGWNENEHSEFGIPFPSVKERFDNFEKGIVAMRETWAKSNPKPAQNPIPLLIGGKGEKRTLAIVAREAAEWNLSRLDAEMYTQRAGILEQHCKAIGRDPKTIRHSVMTSYIIGRTQEELLDRAAMVGAMMPDLRDMSPGQVVQNRRDHWFVGTPDQIAEQMRQHARLGVDLFMLQHFLLDDSDALKLLATEVMPWIA